MKREVTCGTLILQTPPSKRADTCLVQQQAALLTLSSNDPTAVHRHVVLKALKPQVSYGEEDLGQAEEETQVDKVDGETAMISRGCACSSHSSGSSQMGIGLLTLLPVFVYRRYRL